MYRRAAPRRILRQLRIPQAGLKNKEIFPSVTTEVDRPSAQLKQMQTTRGLQILLARLTAREFFCFAVTLPVKKTAFESLRGLLGRLTIPEAGFLVL